MKNILELKNAAVSIEGKKIIESVSLSIRAGELHVLMGPNGSGKSTLAYALAGHPKYVVGTERFVLNGKDMQKLKANERAIAGLFLAFQYPLTIAGLSLNNLLPSAIAARTSSKKSSSSKKNLYPTLAAKMAYESREAATQLRAETADYVKNLSLASDILDRSLNEGFSGGEKKKAEILQMLVLKPKLAILDEPDSGLDVDALKKMARAVDQVRKSGTAILLITHYQRILKYLKPDFVHVLVGGKLVRSGGHELAKEIEKTGYEGMSK